MKVNEKYLIDKIIETLKDDPEYNTGSLAWWYSDSLDIMQPCRMGTAPDLGVDDWELVVVSQDLEYYLPNDSPNSSVKRKSGPSPWGSDELDANDTKNALYTQQRFAEVYKKNRVTIRRGIKNKWINLV